jgi:hypothetical protein
MAKLIGLTEKEIDTIVDTLLEKQAVSPVASKYKRIIDKLQKGHTRIKTASAKAKGRNLQKWAVEKIAALLGEELCEDKDSNDIRSREMGQPGVDVWLHKRLRTKFPIAVECKAQETISLHAFIEQAKNNTSPDLPFWLLVIKNKLIKNPVAVMDWDLFEYLYYFNG